MAQLTGAAEYTDCIFADREDSPTECPGYDTKQSEGEALCMVLLYCHCSQVHSNSDWVLSIGQIELNCVLILNSVVWNRTILTFNLCTYAKLNCLK